MGHGMAAEFDRQVRAYVDSGYPGLLGMTAGAFADGLELLRARVDGWAVDGSAGGTPFVLVAAPGMPAAEAMPRLEVGGRAGFVSADSTALDAYPPIADVELPPGGAYVLLDVERGDEYANRSPDEALPAILGRGRTPLTVAEGIALLTVAPQVLEKNRCFMLLGSRGRDKRVPALWISSGTGKDGRDRRGAPKLGWCWAGNRHTWLGHASTAGRVGTAAREGELSVGLPTMAARGSEGKAFS